jgi:hypothetical protein
LSYAEIVKRALNEFGVKASEQTLTAYFRHRREELGHPGDSPAMKFRERLAMFDRPGMGKDPAELEARTLVFSAMAAYELSLAEPEKMRVKEMRSLMKMLQDHRRFAEERNNKARKLDLLEMATIGKLLKDQQNRHTKAEFEEMMMQATDILSRARQRGKERSSAPMEDTAAAPSANAAAAPETTAEAGRAPDAESPDKDIIKNAEGEPQA